MTFETPKQNLADLNVNAAAVGRVWLTQLQHSASEMFQIEPQISRDNRMVVQIPDYQQGDSRSSDVSTAVPHQSLRQRKNVHPPMAVASQANSFNAQVEMPVDVSERELTDLPDDVELPEEYVDSANLQDAYFANLNSTQSGVVYNSHVTPEETYSATISEPVSEFTNETTSPAGFNIVDVNDIAARIFKSVQQSEIPVAKPIVADLREKPSEWGTTTGPGQTKPDRTPPDTATTTENDGTSDVGFANVDGESISELVDQILDRFPLSGPTLLLFAGSEWNPHVDETCAQVAYQLASRDVGKIVLLDCEMEKSSLSNASEVKNGPGVLDILSVNTPLKSCVVENDACNLEFIPLGLEKVRQWGIVGPKIRHLVGELKDSYQFICASVGDAHSKMAKSWAKECDGAFLVVSMANSSRTVAESAVGELQNHGARILGCIATEAYS